MFLLSLVPPLHGVASKSMVTIQLHLRPVFECLAWVVSAHDKGRYSNCSVHFIVYVNIHCDMIHVIIIMMCFICTNMLQCSLSSCPHRTATLRASCPTYQLPSQSPSNGTAAAPYLYRGISSVVWELQTLRQWCSLQCSHTLHYLQ